MGLGQRDIRRPAFVQVWVGINDCFDSAAKYLRSGGYPAMFTSLGFSITHYHGLAPASHLISDRTYLAVRHDHPFVLLLWRKELLNIALASFIAHQLPVWPISACIRTTDRDMTHRIGRSVNSCLWCLLV